MAGKTFTCVICGETVSKRQSLAVEGGRACRKHSEAVQESKQRIHDEQQKEYECRMKKYEKYQHKNERNESVDFIPGMCHCMFCKKAGFDIVKATYMRLILQKKWEKANGKPFPLIPQTQEEKLVVAFHNVLIPAVIHEVPWEGDNTKIKVPYHVYEFATLAGCIFVCSDCMNEKGFKPYEMNNQNVTLEQLAFLGAVMDSHVENLVEELENQTV